MNNSDEESFQLCPLISKTDIESKTRDIASARSHIRLEQYMTGLLWRSEAAEIVEAQENQSLNCSESTETVSFDSSKLLC